MQENSNTIKVSAIEMQQCFLSILLKHGFTEDRALRCAEVFTSSSIDGIYTHGVNRFPRFIQYIQGGFVNVDAVSSLQHKFGGIEQWNGNLGPGILNAIHATESVVALAQKNGIGCVALSNTNHWMRGGTYGWQAAKEGYVFIGWTNTIANMPTWGAKDARLGNNPLVLALPYKDEAIVLDMAMSQYSYGALELSAMNNEKLSAFGGFNEDGKLTNDPSEILSSQRPLPIGYWKGAGLALLLDLLATILSGGLATFEISKKEVEYGLSQVFIAIDISKLGNHSTIAKIVERILNDYHQSVPADEFKKIVYPGERILLTRKNNLANGIPVLKKVWDEIGRL
ncbi:MAG: 3-dehydro-L-gulonate 2-dehydrogenase [Bacteroidota bacterium]|nr:3-dehydro-L-gulonate 2-dehydrogenase [Bacteroidota bacterium]